MEFYPRLKSHLIILEGYVDHLYLDTVGKVTVGVGFMLPTQEDALRLHFMRDNRQATNEEIIRDYHTIKVQVPGKLASAYKKFTQCYLPDDEIERILTDKISGFEGGLHHRFAEYFNFPIPVRLGIFDMAYNLGLGGLTQKFPKFCRSVDVQDWASCAKECKRGGIGDKRNEETRKLFESA